MRSLLIGSVAAVVVVASVYAQPSALKSGGYEAVVAPKSKGVAPAKPTPKSNPTTAPRGSTMAPLTASECEGLGGTVKQNFTCKGGSGCYTVDRYGVIRMACINK